MKQPTNSLKITAATQAELIPKIAKACNDLGLKGSVIGVVLRCGPLVQEGVVTYWVADIPHVPAPETSREAL